MIHEVIEHLRPKRGQVVIDATLGLGGHSLSIWGKIEPDGILIGFEKDRDSLYKAMQRLSGDGVVCIKADYAHLKEALGFLGLVQVDGVLFDLGLSSYLLEESRRGFSFLRDEELDMRFNPNEGLPAQRYLATLSQDALKQVFSAYGEERFSGRIAREIAESRRTTQLLRTQDLNALIERVVPRSHILKSKQRVYQALRILVNRELHRLVMGLSGAVERLTIGGHLVVISYHSLEDRIVKALSKVSCLEILTKKPLRPRAEEISENRRARSAVFRAFKKIDEGDEKTVKNRLDPCLPALRHLV
jgi:16S rRNA (cytosine1402-N4)-methyltransferase